MGGREGWEGRTLAPGGCFHPQSVPPASSQPALSAMEEKGGGTGVGGRQGGQPPRKEEEGNPQLSWRRRRGYSRSMPSSPQLSFKIAVVSFVQHKKKPQ